jgi:hypothetical protein
MNYPFARTREEVYVHLANQPCGVCGVGTLEVRGVAVGRDEQGRRLRTFTTVCGQCGDTRDHSFRFPEEEPPPLAERDVNRRFGGPEPSELLDPGQWLAVADRLLADAPQSVAGLTDAERLELADRVEFAAAALEEVLKFMGEGDRIDPHAFWSDLGHRLQLTAAWRFEREWLESDLLTCQELLAAYRA